MPLFLEVCFARSLNVLPVEPKIGKTRAFIGLVLPRPFHSEGHSHSQSYYYFSNTPRLTTNIETLLLRGLN